MTAWRRLAVLVGLLIAGFPRSAQAVDIPAIGGHLTDVDHLLGDRDKQDFERKLEKLQQDTQIDVAGWLVDAPEDSLEGLGHQAYSQWHLGQQWDGGVLFVVPKVGCVVVVQDPAGPRFSAAEVAQITSADEPGNAAARRLDVISDAVGLVVRTKADRFAPAHRLRYVFGPTALLLAALALAAKKHRTSEAVNADPPSRGPQSRA